MADVELMPCPFCGAGKTEIRENGRPWLGMRYGEPVSVSVRHWCEPIEGQPSRMIERVGRDRAAAIAAWNTRATDANLAAPQAEIRALRAEVERADTAEALLRQVLEVLGRAHHVAMEQTLKARIPECGEFAGIAQDLDFVVAAMRGRLGEGAGP